MVGRQPAAIHFRKGIDATAQAFDPENLSIEDKVTGQQRIAPQHEHRALPGLGDLAAPNNAALLLQHRPRPHQGDGLAVPSGSVTSEPILSVGAPA